MAKKEKRVVHGKEKAKERARNAGILSTSYYHLEHSHLFYCFYMGTGFFTCTFLPCADKSPERPSLEVASALDAAASAADDVPNPEIEENDASVQDIGQQRPSGSEASTPSPGSPHRIASHPPHESTEGRAVSGTDTEEEGETGEEVDDAETGAVKGKAPKARKRKERCDTESDEPEPASKRGSASKRPAFKATKRPKPKPSHQVVVDSDDSVDGKASRYKSVSTSMLHKAWHHSTLDLVRKEFQQALLASDGFPAKVSSLDRPMNMKQLLVSAKVVLEQTVFKKFKQQVDQAYQDTSKE